MQEHPSHFLSIPPISIEDFDLSAFSPAAVERFRRDITDVPACISPSDIMTSDSYFDFSEPFSMTLRARKSTSNYQYSSDSENNTKKTYRSKKERMRERNRMAAHRSRLRKIQQFEFMQQEIGYLRQENQEYKKKYELLLLQYNQEFANKNND